MEAYTDSMDSLYPRELSTFNSSAPEIQQPEVGDQSNFCEDFVFYFNVFVIGIIGTIGLTGNTISLLVLQRERSSRSALLLLQSLAVADNLLLTLSVVSLTFVSSLVPYWYQRSNPTLKYTVTSYFIVYGNPIGMMVKGINLWMTAVLAINRFIVIRLPLKASTLCTARAAWIQITCVYVGSVLVNIPSFWQYELVQMVHPYTNTPISVAQPTAFGPQTRAGTIYENIIHSFLMLGAPLLLLIIFTVMLVFTIRKIAKNHHLGRCQDRVTERRITTVMLVVMAICITCHVPERVYSIVKAALKISAQCQGDDPDSTSVIMSVLAYVSNLLIVINSTVNFFVYYILRKKFRQNMVLMCCRSCASDEYLLRAQRQSSSKIKHLSLKTSLKDYPRWNKRGMSVDSTTSLSTMSPMSALTSTPHTATATPQTAMSSLTFNFNNTNGSNNNITGSNNNTTGSNNNIYSPKQLL